MFDFFRRMILPIISIALIGFLATIIFQWGADITSRSKYESRNLAAVINGEEVTWTEYQQIYDNLYKTEQQNSDEDLTDAKQNELHNTAWNQIQYDRLILQEVDKLNISVSDDELYDFLKYSPPFDFQQSPAFQTNGQFDYQKYLNGLADPNFATQLARLDPYFRLEIKKLKLQEMIIQAAHVTENEIKDYFIAVNEKIKIASANVKYGPYTRPGPKSTDEEHQAYYQANQDDYILEERVSLNAVIIEKKPSRDDWEAGHARIKLIADSITAGANFADMAKVYSEDGSAASGGDLGWFPKGQMVREFDRMVFTLKDGDVSPPVRTQFGWHIIKSFGFKEELSSVSGKEDKEMVKKAKASHILIKVLTSQETLDIANNKLNQFRTDALETSFSEAAVKNDLPPKKIAPFKDGANMQNLGRDVVANEFAFGSELNAISQVLENSSRQFVIQLAENIPEGVAPYEQCKEKVARDLLTQKVVQLCIDTAAVLWTEIQNGASLEVVAKNHNIEYSESDMFARGEYVKGLNSAPEAIGAAFALQNKNDMSGPVNYNQGTVILKLLDKTSVDLNEFTAKKDSISNIILSSKQQELFGRWFDNLIKNSEIINNIQTIRAENSSN